MSGPVSKASWVTTGDACAACKKSYGIFGAKKKNCFYCGRLLCNDCVNAQITVVQGPDRVCLDCFANIQNERQKQHQSTIARQNSTPTADTTAQQPPSSSRSDPPANPPTPLRAAAQDPRSYRTRIIAIYRKYAPDRMHIIDATLEKYKGSEDALMDALVKKYGPEPPVEEDTTAPSSPAPAAPGAGDAAAPAVQRLKERIRAMYEVYAPDKLPALAATLQKYKQSEEALLQALVKKYGPEPTAQQRLDASLAGRSSSTAAGGDDATAADVAAYRQRMMAMYSAYAPEKLSTVDASLEKYKGNEAALMDALVKKYGPEPTSSDHGTSAQRSSATQPQQPGSANASGGSAASPQTARAASPTPATTTEALTAIDQPQQPSLSTLPAAAAHEDLRRNTEALLATSSSLRSENDSWATRCTELSDKINQLTADHTTLSQQYEATQLKAADTASQLAAQIAAVQALETRARELEAQLSAAHSDRQEDQGRTLVSQESALAEREAALNASKAAHESAASEASERQAAEHAATAARLEAERQELDAAKSALEAERAALASSAAADAEAMAARRKTLEEEQAALQAERKCLEQERDAHQATTSEARAALAAEEKRLASEASRLASDEAKRKQSAAAADIAFGEREKAAAAAKAEADAQNSAAIKKIAAREERARGLERSVAEKVSALEVKIQSILKEQEDLKHRKTQLEQGQTKLVQKEAELKERELEVAQQLATAAETSTSTAGLVALQAEVREAQRRVDAQCALLEPFLGADAQRLASSEFVTLKHNRWTTASMFPPLNIAAVLTDSSLPLAEDEPDDLPVPTAAAMKAWIAAPTTCQPPSSPSAVHRMVEHVVLYVADLWCLVDTVVTRNALTAMVRALMRVHNDGAAFHNARYTLTRCLWVSHLLERVYRPLLNALASHERLAVLLAAVGASVRHPGASVEALANKMDPEVVALGTDDGVSPIERVALRTITALLAVPRCDVTDLMDTATASAFHATLSTLVVSAGGGLWREATQGPAIEAVADAIHERRLTNYAAERRAAEVPSIGGTSTRRSHLTFVMVASALFPVACEWEASWQQLSKELEGGMHTAAAQTGNATSPPLREQMVVQLTRCAAIVKCSGAPNALDAQLLVRIAELAEQSSLANACPSVDALCSPATMVKAFSANVAALEKRVVEAEGERDSVRAALASDLEAARAMKEKAEQLQSDAQYCLDGLAEREARVSGLEARLADVVRREAKATQLYETAVEIQVRNGYEGVLPAERERLQSTAAIIAARELKVREAESLLAQRAQRAEKQAADNVAAHEALATERAQLAEMSERLKHIEARESLLQQRESAYVKLMATSKHTDARVLLHDELEQRLAVRLSEADAALRMARGTSARLERAYEKQRENDNAIRTIKACETDVSKAIADARHRRQQAAQGFVAARGTNAPQRPIDNLERAVFQLTSALSMYAQ